MNKNYFIEWIWKAPMGLALVGFGACVVAEGSTAKAKSAPFSRWFSIGTLGLIILNTGLPFFGEAVKARTHYEWERDRKAT